MTAPHSSRPRAGWMDMLRGLAVVLVAVFHIQYPLVERVPGTPDILLRFGEAMQPFRMPLLFFLSGLLLPRSLTKPAGAYVWGKVRGLVWPFVLWTLVVAVAFEALWRDDDPWWLLMDAPAMLMGWQHLWFLSVLIVCYAIAPLTRIVPAWVFPVPMAVVSSFMTSDVAWVDYGEKVLWYGAFFFAGAAVAGVMETWQRLSPVLPAVMVMFTVVWGYLAAQDAELRTTLGFATFTTSLVGVLAVTWLAPRLPRLRFLEWVGRGSIVVYLVNLTTITLAFETIDTVGITEPWSIIALLVIAGLVVPVAMVPLARTPLFVWPAPRTARRPAPRIAASTS
ncbi:acyltransferase family protein [Brevibacterium yomogidense]|uniref:acyltransferase family protein n=1 Tax=Brevibacterium yomogidense TaxID=946573 RepID=UPI0018DF50EB|nr:acyltransferase [Brevibacterium yomogidense]